MKFCFAIIALCLLALPANSQVNDNGNEVLRKSADRETQTSYRIKMLPRPVLTTAFQAKKTTISTSATKINFPDEGNDFLIYHIQSGASIWLGQDNGISIGDDDVIPLPANTVMSVNVVSGNDVEMYGIVNSGTVDIYVVGMIRQ